MKRTHAHRVELLKDVFTMIHPELTSRKNPRGNVDNEERKSRVTEWLKNVKRTILHEESPWVDEENDKHCVFTLLPRFMKLLRECVVSHQWTQVLSMLDCVSHLPYGADWVTWKANLATLYTEPENNNNLVHDFFKQCYLLGECNVRDVALEFVQYLLSQGQTQEATQVIQSTVNVKRGVKRAEQSAFTRCLMDLLDAYQGLVFYVDWKAALKGRESASQQELSQSFYGLVSSQGLSDDAIRKIAQRALLGLDSLPNKSGVWDIFVSKSVEVGQASSSMVKAVWGISLSLSAQVRHIWQLLCKLCHGYLGEWMMMHQFYGEFEEARSVLSAYRDRNPDNPNAHRFLFQLLQSNKAHFDEELVQEETLSCLKGLARLDPANPLVLVLWRELQEQGHADQAVRCIFNLLDSVQWKDRADGWQCLAKSLTAVHSREGVGEDERLVRAEVHRCWSTRRDWWPRYHFPEPSAARPPCGHLLLWKASVASVLLGQDCHFNRAARQVMDEMSVQKLDEVVAKLDGDLIGLLDHTANSTQLSSPPRNTRQSFVHHAHNNSGNSILSDPPQDQSTLTSSVLVTRRKRTFVDSYAEFSDSESDSDLSPVLSEDDVSSLESTCRNNLVTPHSRRKRRLSSDGEQSDFVIHKQRKLSEQRSAGYSPCRKKNS